MNADLKFLHPETASHDSLTATSRNGPNPFNLNEEDLKRF